MKKISVFILSCTVGGLLASPAFAGPRESILGDLTAQAKAADPNFSAFSAERGKALFTKNFGAGSPETPACTSCHGATPQSGGQTRAGKPIDPIGVSKTPDRYTDPKKVDKWFGRNCPSVIGRECTPIEKGDFITFMASQ